MRQVERRDTVGKLILIMSAALDLLDGGPEHLPARMTALGYSVGSHRADDGRFDHLGALRRELRGNQRALELHSTSSRICARWASSRDCCGGAGNSLEEAPARLAALAPDASAGPASRDTVYPLLAEVEKLIPRPARQEYSLFMWPGWLNAKLLELPPWQAANAVTSPRFAEQ
jgi:hypothetical protein